MAIPAKALNVLKMQCQNNRTRTEFTKCTCHFSCLWLSEFTVYSWTVHTGPFGCTSLFFSSSMTVPFFSQFIHFFFRMFCCCCYHLPPYTAGADADISGLCQALRTKTNPPILSLLYSRLMRVWCGEERWKLKANYNGCVATTTIRTDAWNVQSVGDSDVAKCERERERELRVRRSGDYTTMQSLPGQWNGCAKPFFFCLHHRMREKSGALLSRWRGNWKKMK